MPKSKEFLTSSDSEGSDSDSQPKSKKPKKEKKVEKKPKAAAASAASDDDENGEVAMPEKNKDGAFMIELGNMKYATVSEFKGKCYVGVREYYFKEDKLMPGKKGVAMNMDQWRRLKQNLDTIDKCLKQF